MSRNFVIGTKTDNLKSSQNMALNSKHTQSYKINPMNLCDSEGATFVKRHKPSKMTSDEDQSLFSEELTQQLHLEDHQRNTQREMVNSNGHEVNPSGLVVHSKWP
jgi:hypothetical protein